MRSLSRLISRRTVGLSRLTSPSGRRAYGSQHGQSTGRQGGGSSDLPWLIASVSFTVPAAYLLYRKGPSNVGHHASHNDHGDHSGQSDHGGHEDQDRPSKTSSEDGKIEDDESWTKVEEDEKSDDTKSSAASDGSRGSPSGRASEPESQEEGSKGGKSEDEKEFKDE